MTDLVETIARAVAAELGRQDDGTPIELASDLRCEFLDQSDVDFGAVARAVLAAIDKAGFAVVPKETPGIKFMVAMIASDLTECEDFPDGPCVVLRGDLNAVKAAAKFFGEPVVLAAGQAKP